MQSGVVVKYKVFFQGCMCISDRPIFPDINLFIFYGSPQSFDKYVIQCAAFGIHADFYVPVFERLQEFTGCILAALVGIENNGLRHCQGLIKGLHTKLGFKGIAQFPGEHVSAEPVNNSRKIYKTPSNTNVC